MCIKWHDGKSTMYCDPRPVGSEGPDVKPTQAEFDAAERNGAFDPPPTQFNGAPYYCTFGGIDMRTNLPSPVCAQYPDPW